jgi:hypothetical protein
MKISLNFLLPFILFFAPFLILCQEARKPIQVSSLIGDTLDIVERDYYHLLPTIDGFQWAVFYLNEDSTLTVRVRFLKKGFQQDTVILKYRSLRGLRSHIESIGVMKISQRAMPEQERAGKTVVFLLYNGIKIRGELLSVRRNTLLVSVPTVKNDAPIFNQSEGMMIIAKADIQQVIIEGESNVLKGMGLGILIGGGTGLVIGLALGDSHASGINISAEDKALFLSVAIGAIGFVVGTIAGLLSPEDDKTMQIGVEENLTELKSYARFPENEPESLRKIK